MSMLQTSRAVVPDRDRYPSYPSPPALEAEVVRLPLPRGTGSEPGAALPQAMRRARAHIYRPSRDVRQSGRARTKRWVLEFEAVRPPYIEPLMGWVGSTDPLTQVRLTFPDKQSAVAFARRQGWEFSVTEPSDGDVLSAPTRVAEIRELRPRRMTTPKSPGLAPVAPDVVEVASADSFPASDPPAWIWRAPERPAGAVTRSVAAAA